MAEGEFQTLAGAARAETRVRGSTFHALAAPIRTEDDARVVLADVQREHSSATHHCSAWRLHGNIWRANDAGEPSGSAGAPILGVIDGAALSDCMVVVTRYYGGTKLGVGGLIRAYSDAAGLALVAAKRLRATPGVRARIRFSYQHTSAVMRMLERVGTFDVEHGYSIAGTEGEVSFTVPRQRAAELQEQLREATGGALSAELGEDRILYRSGDTDLS
ncbi:hypothetical protein BH23GEM6_BH23GEM6_17050 [soil metagenome]